MTMGCLQLRLLSSLSKVFADEEPSIDEFGRGSMLSNEVYSYQVAYHWSGELKKNVEVFIYSELAEFVGIRLVGLVPSEMPCYADHDDDILRATPGLYPDILLPLDKEGVDLLPGQWRSLWITINSGAENMTPGIHSIVIGFQDSPVNELSRCAFQLEVLDVLLPKQKLIYTEWFHADCIATHYGLDVFSEEHWERIDQFIDTAVRHGINTILTPLFTPPLDTEVGGERPTVQLVDVTECRGRYSFGFVKLKRWIDLCRSHGVVYFEFSHFFTQWGAKHAPKIIATVGSETKRIFGWETDATGEPYASFLSQFLPALIGFIEENDLEHASFFHVSDEPSLEQYEDYRSACEMLKCHLKGYPILDALSDYAFYEKGIVENPIPATNHITPFLENHVAGLWTYFCCAQYKAVANRFMNMPSARSRILGVQIYKYGIKGLLHWGYNFWYSMLSKHPIDPFKVTDADHWFPSGDSFLVYPGQEGPIESLRLEVFYDALQDLRSLELLETRIGKSEVLSMLEDGLDSPITFSDYPHGAEWIQSKREQINRMLLQKP